MKSSQYFNYVLPSQTWVASSTTTQTLKDLPKMMFGKLAHVIKFLFAFTFTPTYSGAPTTVGHNNVFTRIDFWDGSLSRFNGGGNHLRAMERMHTGRVRLPDADTDAASTAARYYRRVLHCGPPQFEGFPTDFAIPCGMLETGELRFSHGALADFEGTVSAATATVRIIAVLVLMDEIRIPPAYQVFSSSLTAADSVLQGQALYEYLALINSSSFDAFTAGDVGNVELDFGFGNVVPNVNRADLTALFLDDFQTGDWGINGDLEAATDDNAKMVNRGTPTAVAASTADLQPIIWSAPGSRITKMFEAKSSVRLKWTGSQSTAVALYARILPQPPPVVAKNLGMALSRIGATQKSIKIKTLSKQDFKHRYTEYMPWKVGV